MIISDLSERFACYLNEVAYMFVNNQASFCNAYHLDNGTIDGMILQNYSNYYTTNMYRPNITALFTPLQNFLE